MRIRTTLAVAAALALVACKSKSEDAPKPAGKAPAPPAKKIDGPSVSPVVTTNLTFVVPKTAAWWGEMSFACYRAVMSLTGNAHAGEAFERLSPNVVPAMTAGGIDLGRDLAAVGAFDCGDGSPCMYVAARLEHPEKIPDVLKVLVPGTAPKDLGKGHYSFETEGVAGPRTVHIRVVPIQWGGEIPDDKWSHEMADATHVVFIGGIDGKNVDLDPLAALADAKAAAARVTYAEAAVSDAHGRCLVGDVGARDFMPGFKIDRARFAIAAPQASERDPLMAMIGSKRTLDVEVELTLSPAPTAADAEGWIAQGKLFLAGIGANVRQQFDAGGATGDVMDVYFDMMTLVGTKAFRHEVKDKALRLSWRTDRVPQADLTELEHRVEAVLPGGFTP